MPTFKELIIVTDFTKVWEKFIIHYPNKKERFDKFSTLYKKLKLASPFPNETNMYIYINAFQETIDGDSICINEFSDEDDLLHFDVCGMDDEWIGYSIASSKFSEWLGYYIDEESLITMTNECFVAHCLWEMTFYYGYDDGESI
ncbi:DUF6557 family protein [Paenibacillus sp. LHD-38]|uniref:DUF6557 family protein n=1 Tax=Paenibacillus sp. LHD-38 TaxID=3072143 RepID=UPI00280CDCF5|nr:DUF6557 family protein [Paenibacillus sp. LHD-38]MDQ8735112.1 hypothetical protein [Paenibacillus sp. LHD-38]